MATFEYIAKDSSGQQVTGAIQADSEQAVVRSLQERSLFPVRVDAQEAGVGVSFGQRIRMRDIAAFYGQLSDLLRAGVPLMRSLETIARASSNKLLSRQVRLLHEGVAEGKTLAEAMTDSSDVFPPLHVAMVRAGERAGFLEDVFANLGSFLERQDELRSKVRGAMIYPAILSLVGAVAMIVILVWLVPQFRGIFEDMPLPLPTVILFGLSDLLVNRWPLLIAGLVLGGIVIGSYVVSQAGREAWDRWKLKLPLLGKVTCSVCITRFCRILGTMLHNGVPILQAMEISKEAAGNRMLAESIQKASENVRAGEPLAQPLKEGGVFPPEVIEMIAVAEESNQLERVLVEIADQVERRTNRAVDNAVRLVEPLILVLMAAVIGFAAFGLFYPIFTIARTMK